MTGSGLPALRLCGLHASSRSDQEPSRRGRGSGERFVSVYIGFMSAKARDRYPRSDFTVSLSDPLSRTYSAIATS